MAYDEALAGRIRGLLGDVPAVTERKMFGGLSFMVQGNYACGITDTLVVRVGAEQHEDAMAQPFTRIMDFSGRPMKGWIYVDPPGYAGEAGLAYWVKRGVTYAQSLPAK
jgi:hypothetical protein